jgi:hypothetical protein
VLAGIHCETETVRPHVAVGRGRLSEVLLEIPTSVNQTIFSCSFESSAVVVQAITNETKVWTNKMMDTSSQAPPPPPPIRWSRSVLDPSVMQVTFDQVQEAIEGTEAQLQRDQQQYLQTQSTSDAQNMEMSRVYLESLNEWLEAALNGTNGGAAGAQAVAPPAAPVPQAAQQPLQLGEGFERALPGKCQFCCCWSCSLNQREERSFLVAGALSTSLSTIHIFKSSCFFCVVLYSALLWLALLCSSLIWLWSREMKSVKGIGGCCIATQCHQRFPLINNCI